MSDSPAKRILKIATRQSPLALWQANSVAARMQRLAETPTVELAPMTTAGDRWQSTSLAKLGGKGLFVKELERALLQGEADLAVHSMKDVTAVLPDGLVISTVLEREDPFDAFVSNRFASLDELPERAVIGTCSPRRVSQLKTINPKWRTKLLRGNVNTRLAKLDAGEFDAIILACAGLIRLGFESRIRSVLTTTVCLPAVGQGTIGVEIRRDDEALHELLKPLHHPESALRLAAERGLSASLNGGCSAPIAGFATLHDRTLTLDARVISMNGHTLLTASASLVLEPGSALDSPATLGRARALGTSVADQLRADGAQAVLDQAAIEVLV